MPKVRDGESEGAEVLRLVRASDCRGREPPAPPDPRAYPPKHLVEKILTTCSALEGEGKQVIVLVAEREGIVVGYDVRQKPPRIGLKKAQRFLDPPDVA